MSEENTNEGQEPEGNENEGGNANEEFKVDDLPEEAQKIIRNLRKENAKHRTDKNAQKGELDEYKAWKESQKTELQKAQDKAAELEKELTKTRQTTRQLAAAKKAGLDLDLADRIRGESDEDMLHDAKDLAKRFGSGAGGGSGRKNDVAGDKGKDFLGKTTAESGWFSDFMKG